MKKLLAFLFAATLAFAACKKSDDGNSSSNTTAKESDHTPASEGNPAFSITGIRDVDLSNISTGTITLPLQITQSSGKSSEPVSLSIFDLPKGVYATAKPIDGNTPYGSALTFHTDYSGDGGSFTAHIQGGGPSGTLRYPLVITLPKYNGFEFNGLVYQKDTVVKDTNAAGGNHYIAMLNKDGGVRMVLSFANGVKLPSKAATYRIVPSPVQPDEMQIQVYDYQFIYTSTATGARTGSFTFDSLGKFIFRCSDVELTDGFHQHVLSASFSQ